MARYHVPGYGVREVHPDDTAKADSLGWKRAESKNPMAEAALEHSTALGSILGGVGGTLAGGMAGGIGALPGGLAGAGLGAAAGENVKQTGRRMLGLETPPPFSFDALAGLGRAAAGGVRDEALGLGLGAGVGKAAGAVASRGRKLAGEAAQRFQGNALNPGKAILAEDRNLVSNTLREGVPVSEGMDMAGTQEISKRLRASHEAENEIAAAAQSQWRKNPSEIIAEMEQRIRARAPRNKRLTVIDTDEWKALREGLLDAYSEETPRGLLKATNPRGRERPFDVFSALQAKRAADKASFAARQAAQNQQVRPTNQGEDIEELFNRELGDVLRQDLRGAVPGLGRQMQKTRELMPMEHAYLQAEARGTGVREGGLLKNLLRMQLDPGPMSRRAMRLHERSQRPLPTFINPGIPFVVPEPDDESR